MKETQPPEVFDEGVFQALLEQAAKKGHSFYTERQQAVLRALVQHHMTGKYTAGQLYAKIAAEQGLTEQYIKGVVCGKNRQLEPQNEQGLFGVTERIAKSCGLQDVEIHNNQKLFAVLIRLGIVRMVPDSSRRQ